MRLFATCLAAIAGLFLAASAPAQPARDWRTQVTQTSLGAYVIGNPAAKVKLVEYLSYTCPHCAHFVEQSKATLRDDFVRRGLVQVELRHAIRDPLDLSAAMIARCAGPRGFAGATQAIFSAQESWYPQGARWWDTNAASLRSQPEVTRLKQVAYASGLTKLMQRRGMTPAQITQCFATTADLAKLTEMAQAAWATIPATPSFTINGVPGKGSDWATLETELRATGVR